MGHWNIAQSRRQYNIDHWSSGYFDINEAGRICVKTGSDGHNTSIDLYDVSQAIQEQGLHFPVLLRVTHILQERVNRLSQAFENAIKQKSFKGGFTPVYPIKVNQQRTVVEHILKNDKHVVGLEAGSKPELMVVLAYAPQNGIIICNGYKDREYIRLALIGRELGYQIYIVIEKLSELTLIIEESTKLGIEPLLGIRIRLYSIGKGNWQNTGGEKSKFGLSATHVLEVVKRLAKTAMLPALQLIHCHLGSQLANIRDIQKGLIEVARFYAELHKLGVRITTVDVGGGLGVDYEGTRSRSYCSMNYTISEYANDVVHALWEVCRAHDLPHPNIITESGRALTAHHAVLITNVVDSEELPGQNYIDEVVEGDPAIIQNLTNTLSSLNTKSAVEAYHDAMHWFTEANGAYMHGLLNMQQRAHAEQLYYAICRKTQTLLQSSARSHREILDDLSNKLADKYFCNLSIFQSLPDVWAINQVFPIIPLHRLDEKPEKRVILQDITCDSDGSISCYVNNESVETTLAAHEIKPHEPYLLGFFMVGAYQEILGDMHNLFGDTHSINLQINKDGSYLLSEPEHGDAVEEVLRYVHFDTDGLMDKYRKRLQERLSDHETCSRYLAELEAGLLGYTYLED